MNRSPESRRGRELFRLALVFSLTAVLTALHYGTVKTHVEYHSIYRELYFIPIILTSLWYGLEAGLGFCLLVIAVYVPHVLMTWTAQPGVNVGNILQILAYILVAAVTGHLADRERERQREMREAQNLAVAGKASLAMSSELQELLKTLKELLEDDFPSTGSGFQPSLRHVVDRITTLDHALSHYTQGLPGTRKDFVETDSAIERIKRKLKPLAVKSGVAIEARLQPALGLLAIDESDFLWMLGELTKNAIESSMAGGTVTIASRWSEDQCEIEVRDRGAGIPSRDLSRIFVPFYTTKEKGTGLGLPVCRKIMRDNGGDIRVSSEEGGGTSCVLVFQRIYPHTSR